MSEVYVAWSFDDGYGNIKVYNGFSEPVVVPSFYTDDWFPFKKHEFQQKVDPMEHITVVFEGKKYLVGYGAQINADVNWNVDDNKHLDRTGFYVSFHLALAFAAKDHPEDELFVWPLTMGLPVRAYEDPSRHKLLRDYAIGTHNIDVTLADGTRIKKTVHVKELIIKKQPFGSFCCLFLDEDGNIVNDDLKHECVVVSDIGAKTHNIYTADGVAPRPNYCDQTENGVFSFYSRIKDYVEEKTNLTISDGQLPIIVKDGRIGKIKLDEVIPKEKMELATRVLTDLSKLLGNYKAHVVKVIFTGGGSVFIHDELQKHVKEFFPLLNPKQDVIFLNEKANVIGLRRFGVMAALEKGKTIIQPEKVE